MCVQVLPDSSRGRSGTAQLHPGVLVKIQDLIEQVQGGAWDSALLTSSQVMDVCAACSQTIQGRNVGYVSEDPKSHQHHLGSEFVTNKGGLTSELANQFPGSLSKWGPKGHAVFCPV